MALLPLLLNELLEEQMRPLTIGDLYDQHFGLGIDDVSLPSLRAALSAPALRAGYLHPWRHAAVGDSGLSSIKSDDKEFSIRLDVTHFKPEEVKVKLDDDGRHLVVEGKHEERSDAHGFISRQFIRRYKVPDDVDLDSVQSSLSSDGVLTLQAAKKPKQTSAGREIPIVKTNQPALKKEEEPPKEAKDEDKKDAEN